MNSAKREAYEKWIDRLRKIVAIGMGVCFVAFVFTNGRPAAIGPLIGACSCVILTIALAFEYLIRVLFFRPGRTLPWYQFSLSGMLILTTCVALVCAWLKIIGSIGILWLILALLVLACIVERACRNR